MSDKVRIALDAMGGDHGPAVVVAGADLALARHPETEFLFFGNTALVAPLVDARPALKSASQLVHTDIAVRMEDKPSQALALWPVEILDVARHRRGQERRRRRRRCRAAIPAR